MADEQHAHAHHVPYTLIFILLCIFTALSWGADEAKTRNILENKAVVGVIVLAIAVAKALCVMLFFMHLKFERNWKYVLLAPTTILAIGLPLALLPDVGVHYYQVDVPQLQDVEHHGSQGQAHSEPAQQEH